MALIALSATMAGQSGAARAGGINVYGWNGGFGPSPLWPGLRVDAEGPVQWTYGAYFGAGDQARGVADGPFHAYLLADDSPLEELLGAGLEPENAADHGAVHLGEVGLTPGHYETYYGLVAADHVAGFSFEVPKVDPGGYVVVTCNVPCSRELPIAGFLETTVAPPPTHLRHCPKPM